jgi:hypothetical protein
MVLVIGMDLYKELLHSNQFTHNGLANTLDMAEVLTTALDHKKPPVCNLRRQDGQMVLTVKMILLIL